MIRLSRKYRFSASHRLYSRALTEQQNRETYGKCANPHGHGHDYEVEVTVSGPVDCVTGKVVDLTALDALVERQVLIPFRYKNLNEIAAFRQAVPTTENLTLEVEGRLQAQWAETFGPAGPRLEKVRIGETERNICEIGTR